MKKGAIQLSINLIVTVIIGIIIVLLGITLTKKIISESESTQQQIDTQLEEKINSLLDEGEIVAITPKTRTIHKGLAKFAVGVENILENTFNFKINVEFIGAYDDQGNEICKNESGTINGECCSNSCNPNDWILFNKNEIGIDNNENHKWLVAITPDKDAKKGTYIFSISVFYCDTSVDCASVTCDCDNNNGLLTKYSSDYRIYENIV